MVISSRLSRVGQGGQGLTEYLIILALIVIAAIGAYSFFGQATRQESAQERPGKKAPAKEGAGAPAPAAQAKAGGEKREAGTFK